MTDGARREALAQTQRIADRCPQAFSSMIHLRERLDAAGVSQTKLANVIMRPYATINNWCTGRTCPVGTDLPQIAAALGCTIAELFIPPTEDDLDELYKEAWPE